MKLRVLKKRLKQNCNYFQTENTSLYIDQRVQYRKINNKWVWKSQGYEYIVYAAYDSFICESEEWKLYCNKELKEYVKQHNDSCFICNKINATYDRYISTIIYLYKSDSGRIYLCHKDTVDG